MLRDMNIKIDFIEKRDNNMKLKFLLQPYQEENPWDSLPELQVWIYYNDCYYFV